MHKLILGAAVVAFGAWSAPAAFAQDMTLTSAEVSEGSTIKDAQVANCSAEGGNISPSLSWSGAPNDTSSPSPSTIPTRRPAAASGTGSCLTSRLQPPRSRPGPAT